MRSAELQDIIGRGQELVQERIGDKRVLGVIPGTGWKEGIGQAFEEDPSLAVTHAELGVPLADQAIEGHGKKQIKFGTIEGRTVALIDRAHPHEDITNPDLRQASMILIGSIRPRADGVLITNGVGTLHGPIGLEGSLDELKKLVTQRMKAWGDSEENIRRGGLIRQARDDLLELFLGGKDLVMNRIESATRTTILDIMGWAQRGRRQEPINQGDVVIVTDVITALLGTASPLDVDGGFVDFYNHDPRRSNGGIHRDGDLYFNIVRQAVEQAQGRCPLADSRFILGPQFEGPGDKRRFRGHGDDIIGMSGPQDLLSCVRFGIPAVPVALATNKVFGFHAHEDNVAEGKRQAPKTEKIVRDVARTWPKKKVS